MITLPEPKQTLWTLIVSPTIWAIHFLACYILAAIHCAKPGLFAYDFTALRITIAILTAVALAGIVFSAAMAWRQSGSGAYAPPHSRDTPEDRHRFLGFAILLLTALSFVAVVYTALPVLFIDGCRP